MSRTRSGRSSSQGPQHPSRRQRHRSAPDTVGHRHPAPPAVPDPTTSAAEQLRSPPPPAKDRHAGSAARPGSSAAADQDAVGRDAAPARARSHSGDRPRDRPARPRPARAGSASDRPDRPDPALHQPPADTAPAAARARCRRQIRCCSARPSARSAAAAVSPRHLGIVEVAVDDALPQPRRQIRHPATSAACASDSGSGLCS